MRAWTIVRDILMCGTGLLIIYQQIWEAATSPGRVNPTLLVVALVLTAPALGKHADIADRAREILSGPGGVPSPPSSEPPTPPEPSSSASSPGE